MPRLHLRAVEDRDNCAIFAHRGSRISDDGMSDSEYGILLPNLDDLPLANFDAPHNRPSRSRAFKREILIFFFSFEERLQALLGSLARYWLLSDIRGEVRRGDPFVSFSFLIFKVNHFYGAKMHVDHMLLVKFSYLSFVLGARLRAVKMTYKLT